MLFPSTKMKKRAVVLVLLLAAVVTSGEEEWPCPTRSDCQHCREYDECVWCALKVKSTHFANPTVTHVSQEGRCLHPHEADELCTDANANVTFPGFANLFEHTYHDESGKAIFQLEFGAEKNPNRCTTRQTGPETFSGIQCEDCYSVCHAANYVWGSDSSPPASHLFCGNSCLQEFSYEFGYPVKPVSGLTHKAETYCKDPKLPQDCAEITSCFECLRTGGNCGWCALWTASADEPHGKNASLYGGFCRPPYFPCDDFSQREYKTVLPFSNAEVAGEQKTVLLTDQTYSWDQCWVPDMPDVFAYSLELNTKKLCFEAGGLWCKTILNDEPTTEGGICVKTAEACDKFNRESNFLGLVTTTLSDTTSTSTTTTSFGPCNESYNCVECRANTQCVWCGLKVTSRHLLDPPMTHVAQEGRCIDASEADELCTDANANVTFPGFANLFEHTYHDGWGTVIYQLEFGVQSNSGSCTSQPVVNMFSGAECTECPAGVCHTALYVWGDATAASHHWCADDRSGCLTDFSYELGYPVKPVSYLADNPSEYCPNIDTKVPKDCASEWTCSGCLSTGSCGWCSLWTADAAEPHGRNASLYGGFCRSPHFQCDDFNQVEYATIVPFANAEISGVEKTTLLTEKVEELEKCWADDAPDDFVYDLTRRTYGECRRDHGIWCGTAMEDQPSTLGGVCSKYARPCLEFDADTRFLGLRTAAL